MLSELTEWHELKVLASTTGQTHLNALFATDPFRFANMHRQLKLPRGSMLLDFSKQRLTRSIVDKLLGLARARNVPQAIADMFAGKPINVTEGRAVLHAALRGNAQDTYMVNGESVMPQVLQVRERMLNFAEQVREGHWQGATSKRFTDVVNLGIGGSDLGPQMMVEALRPFHDGPEIHFVSNVDGAHLADVLAKLDPSTTLFVIASKTFTTIETMTNARTARQWIVSALGEKAIEQHFIAVSTNTQAVQEFGIDTAHMFGFWDWVGGRYSVWSSVGLPVAIAIGASRFESLLEGARAMDQHFVQTPFENNLPVLLAMVGVWNINFLSITGLCVAVYDQHLHRFGAHLQQLDMESNGKRALMTGGEAPYHTGPFVFGEPGTNNQHAYFQWLHQGPQIVQTDFIVAAVPEHALATHHELLIANCLAQSQALMQGKTREQAFEQMVMGGMLKAKAAALSEHRAFSGNRPSNTLMLERLDPYNMGALLALYEHKVFVQSIIWGVNAFDQWGVELGKQLAGGLTEAIANRTTPSNLDGSTAGLLQAWRTLHTQSGTTKSTQQAA